jgi:hypothetical protein
MQHVVRRKRMMTTARMMKMMSEHCPKLCSPTCHAARGKEEEYDDHGENDEDDERGLTKLRQQVNVVLIA